MRLSNNYSVDLSLYSGENILAENLKIYYPLGALFIKKLLKTALPCESVRT